MTTKADIVAALITGDGCLARSAEDEPVFVLCARDVLAPGTVRRWADDLETLARTLTEVPEALITKIIDARACADAMDAWQATHYKVLESSDMRGGFRVQAASYGWTTDPKVGSCDDNHCPSTTEFFSWHALSLRSDGHAPIYAVVANRIPLSRQQYTCRITAGGVS